jgi:hypothetical protein
VGRGFSTGRSLFARRRLYTSCSWLGATGWTSLPRLRRFILSCFVLVRASHTVALFSAAFFSFERVAVVLVSAALLAVAL